MRTEPLLNAKVAHRLVSRITGKVPPSTHMDGHAVNRPATMFALMLDSLHHSGFKNLCGPRREAEIQDRCFHDRWIRYVRLLSELDSLSLFRLRSRTSSDTE
jgi:hypothetical protein